MTDAAQLIRERYGALAPVLDEQARRRFAAAEARALGWGGVSLVSRVIGMARSTINRGIAEIEEQRTAGETILGVARRKSASAASST